MKYTRRLGAETQLIRGLNEVKWLPSNPSGSNIEIKSPFFDRDPQEMLNPSRN